MNLTQKLFLGGALTAACFAAMTSATACDGDGGTADDLSDVVYGGAATDEALESVIAATVVTDASQSATFTAPSNGATVPASPSPTFTWKVGAAPANAAPPAIPTSPHAFLERSWSDRAASSIAAVLLGDVRSAQAHGTPTSGPAYFVVFSTSKDPKLLRVFTTETSYTPGSGELAKLQAAGEPIKAIVTHAELEENRIATGGGPFAGVEITFTLQ